MKQFDEFRGVYRPSTPPKGVMADRVGKSALWRAVWQIREGSQAGHWSVYPLQWEDGAGTVFWVPDTDVQAAG